MRACPIAASISASVVTTLANSGMRFSPKLNELIEILGRRLQDVLHIAATRIAGPYRVVPICQSNFSVGPIAKFHNYFRLRIESMHMARLMIFRIREKPNAIEPERPHTKRILRNLEIHLCLNSSQRLLQIR
jgi:hypothetical protein